MPKNQDRSREVYLLLMDGKRLTNKEIPNLCDTVHNMKKRGFKFSSERKQDGRSGKVYFCNETDQLINKQNEVK